MMVHSQNVSANYSNMSLSNAQMQNKTFDMQYGNQNNRQSNPNGQYMNNYGPNNNMYNNGYNQNNYPNNNFQNNNSNMGFLSNRGQQIPQKPVYQLPEKW
jgi:hypothetical protein